MFKLDRGPRFVVEDVSEFPSICVALKWWPEKVKRGAIAEGGARSQREM